MARNVPARKRAARKPARANGSARSGPRSPKSLPLFVEREFLTPRELRAITGYVLAHEPDFTDSAVIPEGLPEGKSDPEYRKSRVLYDLGEYRELVQQRLLLVLPDALKIFNRDPFDLSHIDIQVTASNHGDFFKAHNDNGHADPPDIPRREISFVHYFNVEPKAFSGGHLRFYDSADGRIENSPERRMRTIIPSQNMLVLFPSSYVHEVLPVKCPSGKFAHSRFTTNGWFIRQEPTAPEAADGEAGQDMSWLIDAVKSLTQQVSHSPQRLYITLEEAAEFSGLSFEYLGQLIQGQQLKAVYDGGWKIRRADLENL